MHDDLLAPLRASIKQDVDAQGKVVEKEVAAPVAAASSMCARRVDLHLVLTLEKHPIRTPQVTGHILASVPEQHLPRHALFARLQHPHRSLCVQLIPNPLCATRIPQHCRRVQVHLLVVAGERKRRRDSGVGGSATATVKGHLGYDGRGAVGKM